MVNLVCNFVFATRYDKSVWTTEEYSPMYASGGPTASMSQEMVFADVVVVDRKGRLGRIEGPSGASKALVKFGAATEGVPINTRELRRVLPTVCMKGGTKVGWVNKDSTVLRRGTLSAKQDTGHQQLLTLPCHHKLKVNWEDGSSLTVVAKQLVFLDALECISPLFVFQGGRSLQLSGTFPVAVAGDDDDAAALVANDDGSLVIELDENELEEKPEPQNNGDDFVHLADEYEDEDEEVEEKVRGGPFLLYSMNPSLSLSFRGFARVSVLQEQGEFEFFFALSSLLTEPHSF